VGDITESLKWGMPSYAPRKAYTGTPLRLGVPSGDDHRVGLYVHCQSGLMAEFRLVHGDRVCTEGTRALLLDTRQPLPWDAVDDFIILALTWKRRRRG